MKTSFDRYLAQRLRNPRFRAAYEKEQAELEGAVRLLRELDAVRLAKGYSKADLARRTATTPEVVRRLSTAASPTPPVTTLIRLASHLGSELVVTRSAG